MVYGIKTYFKTLILPIVTGMHCEVINNINILLTLFFKLISSKLDVRYAL